VKIYNEDGNKIIEKYKDDDKNLLFVDPPYLKACNDFYEERGVNVYEYFYNNDISIYKASIILILENNWIINLLFKNSIKSTYNKIYAPSKKQTQHLIISNK
jgi:site-specific DNA-adenine methylase